MKKDIEPAKNKARKNATEYPSFYYARHITQGVCQYEDERILIGNDTLNAMDASFKGKPVYTEHRDNNLETLERDAVGYVIDSFYLPEDGSHWARIIITSDRGREMIRQGCKVSNAYVPDAFAPGGECHAVDYDAEITKGHYLHLALTDFPRYEEAIIMTEEDFKAYRESKRVELEAMKTNSKSPRAESQKKNESKEPARENLRQQINKIKGAVKMGLLNMFSRTVADPDSEIEIDGRHVRLSELIEAYRQNEKAKKNADEDKEKGKEAEDAEEEEEKEKPSNKKKSAKEKAASEDKEKEEPENEDDEEADSDSESENDDEEEEEEKESKKKKAAKRKNKSCKSSEEDEETENEEDGEDEEKAENARRKANDKAIMEAGENIGLSDEEEFVADTMDRKLERGHMRYGSRKSS